MGYIRTALSTYEKVAGYKRRPTTFLDEHIHNAPSRLIQDAYHEDGSFCGLAQRDVLVQFGPGAFANCDAVVPEAVWKPVDEPRVAQHVLLFSVAE